MEHAIFNLIINNLKAQLVLCELKADSITRGFESEPSSERRTRLAFAWHELTKHCDALRQLIKEAEAAVQETDPNGELCPNRELERGVQQRADG